MIKNIKIYYYFIIFIKFGRFLDLGHFPKFELGRRKFRGKVARCPRAMLQTSTKRLVKGFVAKPRLWATQLTFLHFCIMTVAGVTAVAPPPR